MRIVWADESEADLNQIIASYAEIDPSLPMRLIDLIAVAPLPLLDFPFLGEEIEMLGLRKWRAKGTPFILLYDVSPDEIIVARVIHAATDWKPLT